MTDKIIDRKLKYNSNKRFEVYLIFEILHCTELKYIFAAQIIDII